MLCSTSMSEVVAKSLPIHSCIRVGYSPIVCRALKLFPEKAKEKRSGWLPLHEACRYQGTKYSIVKAILDAYPQAIFEQTPKGSTPLHLITSFAADNIDVLRLILNAHPEAVYIRAMGSDGSPSSTQSSGCSSWLDGPGWLPLHYVIRFFGDSYDSVQIIAAANPFVLITRCHGWLPIHLAIRYSPNDLNLLRILLDAFPGNYFSM